MYITNLHVKLMQSFVAAPQVHEAALKNPAMLGGQFINYPAARVGQVATLLGETLKHQSHLIEFAEAVKVINAVLLGEATGYSLEPLYAKVPVPLKGYVELVYDLNNAPSVRFIEGLLYRSHYYAPTRQSIALSLATEDRRAFVFSTPRLAETDRLELNTAFNDLALDELFQLKATPQPLGAIADRLRIPARAAELFGSLFTTQPPRPSSRYGGAGTRIRYFGHACILLESRHTSVLLDPVISYEIDNGLPRYTYADLPDQIDYVLITHNHQDHCVLETLLQLRHKIKNIVVPRSNGDGLCDPSLRLILRHAGFTCVREIDEMEVIEVEDGMITGLPFPGEHADLNVRTKSAYVIQLGGSSVLCLADSNNLEPKLYEHIHDAVGDVDALFIGMECDGGPLTWLYGPLLSKPLVRKMDQSRRFDGSDCQKGMNLVACFKPKAVYVYAMGLEPWLTHLTSIQYTPDSRPIVESNKLVAECQNRGIEAERLYGQKEILLPSTQPDSAAPPSRSPYSS
jgi:L-ascorbate metabolism protein UlaG (beta-lactamase superfamily)